MHSYTADMYRTVPSQFTKHMKWVDCLSALLFLPNFIHTNT